MNAKQNTDRPETDAGQFESSAYLNKRQLAARLGISVRSCDNLIARRALPFVRLSSRMVRFPTAEVDRYIREHLTVRARGQEGGE